MSRFNLSSSTDDHWLGVSPFEGLLLYGFRLYSSMHLIVMKRLIHYWIKPHKNTGAAERQYSAMRPTKIWSWRLGLTMYIILGRN